MTGTGFTVATAAQLLGAKPPTGRELDAIHYRAMRAIDSQNRDDSASVLKRQERHGRSGETGGDRARASPTQKPKRSQPQTPAATPSTRRSGDRDAKQRTFEPSAVLSGGDGRSRSTAPSLPYHHQHRIAKTVRIATDTSVPTTNAPVSNGSAAAANTPTSTLSRNTSNASRRTKRNSQVTEIYFSPNDIHKSQISLSDPLDDPDGDSDGEDLLTPTQARYDDQQTATRKAYPPRPDNPSMQLSTASEEARPSTVTLKPEQVDRLVKALATCPLIHTHVSRQWWDDEVIADDATVLSDDESTVPSLTTGSASTLYSHPNAPFVQEHRSPSVTEAILEEEFAQNFPNHLNAKHPVAVAAAAARSTKFGGIALADPKIHGAPIRFISENYRLGANVLQVGACSFLNIPYGTSAQSHIRIEPASRVSASCRVMLQVVNQILERRSGQKAYLLVAELDVTESFTKAALTELASFASIPLSHIQILHPAEKPRDTFPDIDWCALANESLDTMTVSSVLESTAASFRHLTQETCTMQTLTLLSELSRLKTQHQDSLIVRPTAYHANGVLAGIHVPWTSQHLDHMLSDLDPCPERPEASQAARALRDRVVGAVAEGCVKAREFQTRIWWGDQMRLVRCVPLVERAGSGGRPGAWVCFLSDLGRYAGSLVQAFYTL